MVHPVHQFKADILLVENVSSMANLRASIADSQLQIVLINPKLIFSPDQLLFAVHKSFHTEQHGVMKTKSLLSEILYNLSPSRNVVHSQKLFTISDVDTAVVLVLIGDGKEQLENLRLGNIVPLNKLTEIRNAPEIRRLFKVPKTVVADEDCLRSIINTVATRDFL